MRRFVQTLVVIGALTAVAGGSALAKNVACPGGDCFGTKQADDITGSTQPDVIYAKGGDDDITQPKKNEDHDEIHGGGGDDMILDYEAGFDKDVIFGDGGDDVIAVLEHEGGKDVVDCGEGDDIVFADENDEVNANCETVSYEEPNF
jgi:Ca2+-binding RTX toxin-like protein